MARQTCATPTGHVEDETTMLMEQVVQRANMLAAHRRVLHNRGAPGVDGMTVHNLWAWCQQHWTHVRERLLNGTYRPQPVRPVDIPKPGGGTRQLGIPTVLDRLIQQALLQILTPIFDPTFSAWSFGFRPGRGCHDAVHAARAHMAAGHRWVVDMDLEKFFDRVNHDILMSRVARQVQDRRVLTLIRRYLRAGILEGGVASPRRQGTPQGGPLSPLLSNILLDDLDRQLEQRGHRFVRYADDCNIYVRSRRAGERVLDSLERFLRHRLRLRVNRAKSAVARPWQRSFLGYSVTTHYEPKLKVSPQSAKRLKQKLKPLLRAGRGRQLRQVCKTLTPQLRGWVSYYRLAEVKTTFEQLDRWLRRKLRALLWRVWRRPRTRAKQLIARGIEHVRAWTSATNGRGAWWNAKAQHLNQAITTRELRDCGLMSLLNEHQRLASFC